ncbi:SpaA isopeptide-forming pilin-related protein [Streptomyces griseoincarnatus]|uniref:SpaA isopeptide-forming pilin-related protein n=1 Tax=Streptomyces griseoincarnatus TaxID=29305 RepID=A0ABT0W446_STRGI|nr:SpaA isopeptide-forming pilin-related protein [Streptomyces griseoincarnatus]MCM2518091.1 SpaA isopeptide-forming pilin-related protein [Streptomyces griseoincarnatus]
MHARLVRSVATLVVATAGTLTWAPAVSAQPSEPPPSASAAAETPAPDAGSVEITTKDTAGDALPGAVFLLLDSAGQEAGRGTTDAQGKLTFSDLAPGVYRLKETASGSPLHEVVSDQDVIVTPGATTRLTITDPFKAAKVLLQAKDDETGKLLPGATMNIGTGTSTLLTLTTGAMGTASAELPISSWRAQFWVKEIKAPAGYDLYKPTKTFTAASGEPVTVTVTNAKTATTPPPTEKPTGNPTEKPTAKPTERPSGKPSRSQHGEGLDVQAPSASGTQTADKTASSTTAPVPAGLLAHTGADTTPWLIGGAAALIATGGGALVVARRRRTDNSTYDGTTQS